LCDCLVNAEQVITCKLSTGLAGSYVKVIHKIMTNNILGFIAAGFNVLIYKVHDDDYYDDDE